MRLTIRLRYYTRFGQNLFVCGDHKFFGSSRADQALPLHYVNDEFWEASLDWPDSELPQKPISYYFLLRNPDDSIVEDFGADRQVDIAKHSRRNLLVIDSWNNLGTVENVFFTEPFRKVLLRARG